MDWGNFGFFKKVVGIDPGSHECGLSFFEEGKLKSTLTVFSDQQDPLLRRYEISESLGRHLESSDLIICEQPFLRGPANQTMQRLLGMIEFISKARIKFIAPMSVKAFTGNGKNDKLEVAKGACQFISDLELPLMEDLIQHERWNQTDAVAVVLAWVSKQNGGINHGKKSKKSSSKRKRKENHESR